MEKYRNLEVALSDLKATHESFNPQAFVENVFDIFDLDEYNAPNIKTKNNTIIIYDEADWNANYLVDLIREIRDKYRNLGFQINHDILYYNDIRFAHWLLKREELNAEQIDKTDTPPFCIFISPEKKDISFVSEGYMSVIYNHEIDALYKHAFVDGKISV